MLFIVSLPIIVHISTSQIVCNHFYMFNAIINKHSDLEMRNFIIVIALLVIQSEFQV